MIPALDALRTITVFGALVLVTAIAAATTVGMVEFTATTTGLGTLGAGALVLVAEAGTLGALALVTLGGVDTRG